MWQKVSCPATKLSNADHSITPVRYNHLVISIVSSLVRNRQLINLSYLFCASRALQDLVIPRSPSQMPWAESVQISSLSPACGNTDALGYVPPCLASLG